MIEGQSNTSTNPERHHQTAATSDDHLGATCTNFSIGANNSQYIDNPRVNAGNIDNSRVIPHTNVTEVTTSAGNYDDDLSLSRTQVGCCLRITHLVVMAFLITTTCLVLIIFDTAHDEPVLLRWRNPVIGFLCLGIMLLCCSVPAALILEWRPMCTRKRFGSDYSLPRDV